MLPPEEKNRGLYFIKDSGGVPSGCEEVYSTEETRIGTWIDGKPLYRTVIGFTTPASSSDIDVGLSAEIDTVIDLYGYVVNSGGQSIMNGFFNGTNWFSMFSRSPASNLLRVKLTALYTNRPAVAILKYTKTTDPEVTT